MFHFSSVIVRESVLSNVAEILVFNSTRDKKTYLEQPEDEKDLSLVVYVLSAIEHKKKGNEYWEARIHAGYYSDLLMGNEFSSLPGDALRKAALTLNENINLTLMHLEEEIKSASDIILEQVSKLTPIN